MCVCVSLTLEDLTIVSFDDSLRTQVRFSIDHSWTGYFIHSHVDTGNKEGKKLIVGKMKVWRGNTVVFKSPSCFFMSENPINSKV